MAFDLDAAYNVLENLRAVTDVRLLPALVLYLLQSLPCNRLIQERCHDVGSSSLILSPPYSALN